MYKILFTLKKFNKNFMLYFFFCKIIVRFVKFLNIVSFVNVYCYVRKEIDIYLFWKYVSLRECYILFLKILSI